MERHRIAIVIPAFNEEKTIASVVATALEYGLPVVVDDGSHDQTGAIAAAAGAMVVRRAVNAGYDQALNSGFAQAEALCCEYVVTMDADGQHDPTTLGTFVRSLDDGADVVVGIRDRRQRVAEHIFALVAWAKWGLRDPLCGMKAYRMKIYRELGHFDSYNSIGTEMAIYAAKSGKKIAQVPVSTRERADIPRFGNWFSTNARLLRALWLGM